MEKEIITKLKKYEDFLTYRGISLIDRSEYELTATNPPKLMLSPIFNFVKQFKLLMRNKLSKNKTHKKDVLFLVYTHSHVNTLAPIVKKMKDNFLIIKRDGFTNNVAKKLKRNNMFYNDIEGYLTKESLKNIRKATKLLKNKYKELLKTGEFDKKKLRYLFLMYFPEMIRYIEIINNMLSVEKSRLFVVMNEITTIGNIAAHIAKQKGIKTLCIQHGVMADILGFTPVSADKIAVWGSSSRETLIKNDTPKEKIVITGAPQFDDLALKNIPLDENAIKKLDITPNKKLIFLTTQPVSDMKEITTAVCKAVKSIPGTQLVMKLHPSEYSMSIYKKIAKKEGVNAIITKKYLYPLLNACDLLITHHSTTGMEAMILDKPVITINLTGKPDAMPYAESRAAIGVYKPENIKPAIKSVLKNKDVRKKLAKKAKFFIYDQCYKMDGKASERIITLIDSYLIGG